MIADLSLPLHNLSSIQSRIDTVRQFLSDSLNTNTVVGKHQMDLVSAEITSAIHQIIANGTALLACSQSPIISPALIAYPNPNPISPSSSITKKSESSQKSNSNSEHYSDDSVSKIVKMETKISNECEIIELGSEELLAEHSHFCNICGKGFKRDANLRMHKRAHGNQFKTPEALIKPAEKWPELGPSAKRRYSCPFIGCNRNKSHKKFKPLISAISLKNHFKKNHCPKIYACEKCNKKSFSIEADLRSHLKHCGETRWKCLCGTNFSRKDKLFRHVALFEGHTPAVMDEDGKEKGGVTTTVMMAEATETTVVKVEDNEDSMMEGNVLEDDLSDLVFLDEFMEGFDSVDNFCLQEMLSSPDGSTGLCNGMDDFFNF